MKLYNVALKGLMRTCTLVRCQSGVGPIWFGSSKMNSHSMDTYTYLLNLGVNITKSWCFSIYRTFNLMYINIHEKEYMVHKWWHSSGLTSVTGSLSLSVDALAYWDGDPCSLSSNKWLAFCMERLLIYLLDIWVWLSIKRSFIDIIRIRA